MPPTAESRFNLEPAWGAAGGEPGIGTKKVPQREALPCFGAGRGEMSVEQQKQGIRSEGKDTDAVGTKVALCAVNSETCRKSR